MSIDYIVLIKERARPEVLLDIIESTTGVMVDTDSIRNLAAEGIAFNLAIGPGVTIVREPKHERFKFYDG